MSGALLAVDEATPVDMREGSGPFVVVCEHASNRLPRALGTLGLSAADLDRHIAWDPGAAEIATGLGRVLDATVVLQRYSRLAIDCNRDPALADAITALSETTPIPGNQGLPPEARAARVTTFWEPFHDAVAAIMDRRLAAGRPTALVTIHSFTPIYRGVARPWEIGIISTDERSFADAMLAALRAEPRLVVGDNQPYSAKDNVDYTIRRHGRDRGIAHAMVEVRNDLLAGETGRQEWTTRLAGILAGLAGAARAA